MELHQFSFVDEEDSKIYRIKNVCKYGSDLVYEYYLDGGDLNQVEYSGCDELINKEWSKWLDSPVEVSKKPIYFYEPVIESVDSSSSSTVNLSAPRTLRSRK